VLYGRNLLPNVRPPNVAPANAVRLATQRMPAFAMLLDSDAAGQRGSGAMECPRRSTPSLIIKIRVGAPPLNTEGPVPFTVGGAFAFVVIPL
jgi:hypothetical protein